MMFGQRERKARTITCDCGEILITAFGNVAYTKTPADTNTAGIEVPQDGIPIS